MTLELPDSSQHLGRGARGVVTVRRWHGPTGSDGNEMLGPIGVRACTRQLFPLPPGSTYLAFLTALWSRSCAAIWGDQHADTGLAELHDLLRPWATRPIPAVCRRPSFVSGDGFPAELSFSWRAGLPEVRILFEPATGENSALDSQRHGQNLVRSLTGRPGVSIDRYLAVESLFVADDPHPHRSAVWLSLACRPDNDPHYKVYLNPWISGDPWLVVDETMHRLGLAAPWQPVVRQKAAIVASGAQLDYVALDLGSGEQARVKVYFRHRTGGADALNQLAGLAERHEPCRAAAVMRVLQRAGSPDLDNEPMTGLAFRTGMHGPVEANCYLRLPGAAANDQEAADRIISVMRHEQVDTAAFRRILAALAPAPLEETAGLIELLSYRTHPLGAADIGVYFRLPVHAPEVAGPQRFRPGHGFPLVSAESSAEKSALPSTR